MNDKIHRLETEKLHLSVISDFAVDILTSDTVERVLWHLARNVVAKLGLEDIVVYLMDYERTVLVQKAAFGNKCSSSYDIIDPMELNPGEGVVGTVAQAKAPLMIADTRQFPGYIVDDEERLSELAVPIMIRDKVIGVIDSEHHQIDFYNHQHMSTMMAIASIAATKIERVQIASKLHDSIEQLEHSSKIQQTLFDISELMFQTDSITVFYQRLHSCIGRLTYAQNLYVALTTADSDHLCYPYFVDETFYIAPQQTFERNPELPSITEYVIDAGQPKLFFGDAIRSGVANNTFAIRGDVPQAWLGVPFGEDEFKGIVVIQSYDANILFDDKDKQLLVFVAKYVRNAIERMNHANTLVQANEELKSSNKALDEARAEAVRTCELKSSFLANMSHEIRTPMTAIIGFTEQAIKPGTTQSERQDYLARVLRSSEHVLHLINEILDLSKIESDKLELEHQNFDLFELMADIGLLLEPMARDKSLAFNVNYDYPLPKFIDGDLVRIRQVLLNLCANAVKFTHQGSVSLTVSFDTLHSQLKFAIKDSGIGMSPSELERLFQPFVQADASISRKFGGSGLGLVISQKLVHLMDGRLTVNSVKGKGSCFEMFLPMDVAIEALANRLPMTSLSKPIVDDETGQFTGARVLVAEDNLDNQHLIGILLRRFGVSFETVENGAMAVELALSEFFDLILMDIQMPQMNGQEAVELLRKAGVDCPIIALTANIMKEDVDQYLLSGFNDTLAKPIQLQRFYQSVNHHLSEQYEQAQAIELLVSELQNDTDVLQLKADFKASLPKLMDELALDSDKNDWASLQNHAHMLKGTAGSLGFPRLTEHAANVEHCLRSGLHSQAVNATAALIESCDQSLNQGIAG